MEEANDITQDENPKIKEKTEFENTEIQENNNNGEDKETMETNATEENTAENIPELTTIQKKIDEDGETELQNEKNNENETAGEDIIHTVS